MSPRSASLTLPFSTCLGVLTPGRGNRLVLANTEELHDQIDTMNTRIRQLERALRDLQTSVSTEPHPLLRSELGLPSPSMSSSTLSSQGPSPLPSTSKSDQGSQEQEQSQQPKSMNAPRVVEGPHLMRVDSTEDVVDACGTYHICLEVYEMLTGMCANRDINLNIEWRLSTSGEHCTSGSMYPWRCFLHLFLM